MVSAPLSAHVNRALYPYYDQWMFHFDAVRRRSYEYPGAGAFPDRTTWGMDEERRRQYAQSGRKFETESVLSLTYLASERVIPGYGGGMSSAKAAMEALEKSRPHILVSDIAMPEEDGLSLMRRIRALPGPISARHACAAAGRFPAAVPRRGRCRR